MFALPETYHKTLQASPMRLVFGRDAILNIKHVSYLEPIWKRKQEWINRNNRPKNMCHNILVNRKKNSDEELYFMSPFLNTQIIKCLKIRNYNKSYKNYLWRGHSPNNN